MSARERILAKLRAARPEQPPARPDVAGWYAAHRPNEAAADKARRFRQCIEAAHAEVHAVTPDDWLDTLHAVLRAKGVDKLLVGARTPHGAAALAALPPLGIACPAYDKPVEDWKSELFDTTPASFTAARAAIAETGTLILWPDADEPRLMSLVPPLHVVLLDGARIYDTLFQAMTSEGWSDPATGGLPTNALLVSGPSKTADIQQTLAYGAHGPKELVVLMLQTAAPAPDTSAKTAAATPQATPGGPDGKPAAQERQA